MPTPNETQESNTPVEEGPTNIFGGDTDWDEPELASTDRGDSVEKEAPVEEVAEEVTEDKEEVDDTEANEDAVDTADAPDTDVVDDATDDATDDVDDSDTPTPDDKGTMVPRNRLNKEIEKRKATEERIKALEAKLQEAPKAPAEEKKVEPSFTLDDFTKMQDAMLDGESEEAMGMFTKMMEAQSKQTVESMRETVLKDAREEIIIDKQNTALQNRAAELSAKYPELDSTSDDADEGLIEDVITTRDIYVDRGYTLSDALGKAVDMIVKENELTDRTAKKSIDTPPEEKKKPSQIKKKIEISKKEQGRLEGDSGSKADKKLNLLTMSDEQFASVSKDALRAARGDFI